MTLGKREVTESWKGKHLITLSGELALEGIRDLSQDRQLYDGGDETHNPTTPLLRVFPGDGI
jgi:hypothetical protein